MRNENLELARSSGSDSSPSWASATPRASTTTFSFDFGQAKTVDDLSSQFDKATTLRSSKSSEVLSENSDEKCNSSSSSSHHHHLFPSTSKKILKFGGSGERIHGDSVSGGDEKKPTKESKIARFLRRTQSAQEDSSVPPPQKCSGECSRESHHLHNPHHHQQPQQQHQPLEKIDDTDEETHPRRKFNKIGTDMKFRLGFLKRRHTEGQIHASSVRPQPEEAQKWANSFNDLMASKYGQALFKAFLQREFSEENIEFWLAVEDYRKSRQNKLNSKAQKIFNEFVTAQAPKEVNLDALTREGLVSKMAQPTHSTFDQAQKRVQGLLEADAYSRFLKSDLYMELLHPEQYQNS